MLPSTSSCLRQGPTHVTDTGRCPTPCPNPTEVARLRQLFLCCSQLGASPSSRACSVLFLALRLSHAVVCAATELSVRCSQDLFDLRTPSVLCPNRQGEPVVTLCCVIIESLSAKYLHQLCAISCESPSLGREKENTVSSVRRSSPSTAK